jgi:uncharacterized membrane protein
VLRRWVVRTLRTGVTVSSYALLVAVVGYAAVHMAGVYLEPVAATGTTLGAAFTSPSAEGLVLVGLLMLGGTPLARVVLSLGYFTSVRDRAFTGLTLFVLVVLIASIAVGAFL